MLGVLIADDESIVRCGVRSMLDWEKLGLTVVAEAANGQEALRLFQQFNPAIVITDVKMPLMDGIELIRAIRALNGETKIIILSCYQDFNYAREAVRCGASEYLIKSDIMPADLEKLLLQIKDTIDVAQAKQVQWNEIQGKTQKTQGIVKEKFLADLALGIVPRKESFQEDLQQIGIAYLDGHLTFFNIWICYFERIAGGLPEKEKTELHHGVENLIRQTLETAAGIRGEIFPGIKGEFHLVLKWAQPGDGRGGEDGIAAFGATLIGRVQAEYGYSLSIGVSETFDQLLNLKQACNQAQQACKFRMFLQCGRVIRYRETQGALSGKANIAKVNMKELQDDVYFLKRDPVTTFLADLFQTLAAAQDYESVNLIALELVLVLNNIYAEIARENEDVLRRKKEYYEQIKQLETVADIQAWFQNAFRQLMDYIHAVYNSDRNIIMKALNYINSHYQQDISLRVLSDHIHLSKNYFANLFKQETGESFVEYLTRLRIEKAKLLLEGSDLKTYDIGNAVGIGDSHYFSKVFKKITGLTPTEYKEAFRKS